MTDGATSGNVLTLRWLRGPTPLIDGVTPAVVELVLAISVARGWREQPAR